MDNKKEYIICAAIWYNDNIERANLPANIKTGVVVGGCNHGNCVIPLQTMFPNRKYILKNEKGNKTTQGFLTSKNRFVGREEAAEIALDAGQISEIKGKPYLFSEDLY